MTKTPVSIFRVAHRALLPMALLGLLTACGGGTSSTELEKTAAFATPASAVPSASESAALQAQGAALNAEELGDALAEAKALPADAALVSGHVAPWTAYKSGQVAQKAAALQLPVYRFYNTRTGSHFFTSSSTERDSVQASPTHMTYEGQAFLAAGEPSAGLKPVYRFFNSHSGLHFYTISESERTSIEAHLPQFTMEGVAYHASPVAGTGFKPLYRFFQTRTGAHFYTASETERQNLQDHLSATYIYEGVSYYVATGECTQVHGTAQQATPNACYLANNEAEVNVTLPTSADLAVGDTLKVSGLGTGGWRISQNADQSAQTTLPGAQPLVWAARDSASGAVSEWRSLASSADGNKLVGVKVEGRIYTSTDAGVTWTPREQDRVWLSVASSADGNKLVAGTLNGYIYTSADAGVTWTPRDENRNWWSVASSADGNKLVAVLMNGQVYTSTNSGLNWTAQGPSGYWRSVASSADGNKLVAAMSGGQIYTSSDAGANWTAHESTQDWHSVASSADGNKLVAVVNGGNIYTSGDAGATWTARAFSLNWQSVASSADGNKLIAAAYGNQIYTSTDAGGNWTARASNEAWSAVASSADGNRLVAAVYGEHVYTAQTSTVTGTTGYLQGASGSSIELKYQGNNVFTVIESSGTVTAEAYNGCGSMRNAQASGAWRKC